MMMETRVQEQLNSTFLNEERQEEERFTWFNNQNGGC